jgi:hypothetical protein
MPKPTPNLGISKPKADPATLRNTLREAAVPATHADAPPAPPAPTADVTPRRKKGTAKTQLIGAHLSPDVGKQLRQIALDEDTDVKALLIEAINLLFKTRGKPQIASDPIER